MWNGLGGKEFETSAAAASAVNEKSPPLLCYRGYVWLEQPEDVASAFATWPVVRTNKISKLVKNLKLSFF